MSKEAGLTIRCRGNSKRMEDVITALHAAGWGNRDGMTEYLPLHDDEMYNWQKANLLTDEFFAILHKNKDCMNRSA